MRLGRHHFAYLRSLANGLDRLDSARRYLGVEHAAGAVTVHRQVVERLRALARRRGERRWRLIGLAIPVRGNDGQGDAGEPPSIEAWAEAQGLDGWSEAELQELYAAAFPVDRKTRRNLRLLARQLQVLQDLERVAAETPKPGDAVAGWFDEATARRLEGAGWITLEDLRQRMARGGRWWRAMPGVGEVKAARLAAYLRTLLPQVSLRPRPADDYVRVLGGAQVGKVEEQLAPIQTVDAFADGPEGKSGSMAVLALDNEPESSGRFDTGSGSNRALATTAGTPAKDDREAIDAWVTAKAGSPATARAYRKEAERLLVWCLLERGKPLSSMNPEDCLAYLAFLEHLPADWVSLRHARRHEAGWTPFKGALSAGSRRYALGVLSALFDWLVSAGYLRANPWRLVNRRIADDAFSELDSRAFTPQAWQALHDFLRKRAAANADDPARQRIEFLLAFLEATGLRPAEVVNARLGHLRQVNRGWVLQVLGKGGKARVVVVPTQAVQALERYLQERAIGQLERLGLSDTNTAELPIVASVLDPIEPVSYSALYRSVKRWFGKAIWDSDLKIQEKLDASKASLHWLRHTCGTRALDRGVSLESVQRQLGHADPRTTMRYAKPQLERVQAEMERGFG